MVFKSFFSNIKKFILKIDNLVNQKLIFHGNNKIIGIFTHVGDFIFCIIFVILLYFSPFINSRLSAVLSLFSLAISTIFVFILKYTIKRKRTDYNLKSKFIKKFDPYSFPSGHVSRLASFILTTAVFPLISSFFLILIFFVSLSRISRGYHYFSDCAIGFLIGLISGLIAIFLPGCLYFFLY